MAKTLPPTRREQVSSWNVFDKEHTAYRDYVSDFQKMYKDAGKDVTFAAKYYPTNNKLEEELLILEDLGQRGFRNANRQVGLDLAHTKATLEKLAQFHAASAVRYELKGAYPAAFDRNICSKTDEFKEFREIQAKSFVDALPLYNSSHLKSDVVSFSYLKLCSTVQYSLCPSRFQRSPMPVKLRTCSRPTPPARKESSLF